MTQSTEARTITDDQIERFAALALRGERRAVRQIADRDEAAQIARIAAWRAWTTDQRETHSPQTHAIQQARWALRRAAYAKTDAREATQIEDIDLLGRSGVTGDESSGGGGGSGRYANPPLSLITTEQQTRVRDAVASLPSRLRNVLTWRYLDGLTQSVVASRLGVTRQRVAQLERAALDTIRGAGEKQNPGVGLRVER